MGGEFTCQPKWDHQNGFDNHSRVSGELCRQPSAADLSPPAGRGWPASSPPERHKALDHQTRPLPEEGGRRGGGGGEGGRGREGEGHPTNIQVA